MILVARSHSGVWFDDGLNLLDGIAASFKTNNQHTSIVLSEPAIPQSVILLLGQDSEGDHGGHEPMRCVSLMMPSCV